MPSTRRSPRRVDRPPYKKDVRRGLLALTCFLLTLLAVVHVQSGATEWALGWSKTTVLGGTSPKSRDSLLFEDPHGNVQFLRILEQDGSPRLVHQTTSDFTTFSPPQAIPCTWDSPRQLEGAIDRAGRLHLVWIDRVEDKSAVFYTTYDPATLRCGPSIRLSSAAVRITSPRVTATGDGRVRVAWVEEIGRENGIHLTVLHNEEVEHPVTLIGTPAVGLRVLQMTLVEGDICLAWTQATPFPNEEELWLRRFSLEGDPLSSPHLVGTVTAGEARPFCLTTGPAGKSAYLVFVGRSEQWGGRGKQILLTRYVPDGERFETNRILQRLGSNYHLGRPWIVAGSNGEMHLVWEEGYRFFDIWYRNLFTSQETPRAGCLSSYDGSSHFFPRLLQDQNGDTHAVWITTQSQERQEYTLLYRNTAHPAPLSFWKRAGLPEKGAIGALLYGLVYTAAMAPWLTIILGLGNLIIVFGATLLLRRFIAPALFRSFPTLSLLLPCALLFCLLTPRNPIFPPPPLIQLVFSPVWFEGLLFLVPTLLLLLLVKLFRIDPQETAALFGAIVFWVICFSILSALPATLVGVYV
jgi:hypothetical protein